MPSLFHPVAVSTVLLIAIIVAVLSTNDPPDSTKQASPPRSSSLPHDNPSYGSFVDEVKNTDIIKELSCWRQTMGMSAFFDADDYRPAATKILDAILEGKTIDDKMTGGRVSYLEIHRPTVLGSKRLTLDRVRKYVNLLPRLVANKGKREMENGVFFASIGMWAFASKDDDAVSDKITVMLASRNDIIAIVVVFTLAKPSTDWLADNQPTVISKIIEWSLTSCLNQYGSSSICKVPAGDDKTTVKRNKYAENNWLFFTCVVQTIGTKSSKALVPPDLRTYGLGFDYSQRIIAENNLQDAILKKVCPALGFWEKNKLSAMFKGDALMLITKSNDAFTVPDGLKDKLSAADKNTGCFIYESN